MVIIIILLRRFHSIGRIRKEIEITMKGMKTGERNYVTFDYNAHVRFERGVRIEVWRPERLKMQSQVNYLIKIYKIKEICMIFFRVQISYWNTDFQSRPGIFYWLRKVYVHLGAHSAYAAIPSSKLQLRQKPRPSVRYGRYSSRICIICSRASDSSNVIPFRRRHVVFRRALHLRPIA